MATTKVFKDIRDGWVAETVIPVKDNQELRLWTSKGYSGQITTSATIGYRHDDSSWSTTFGEDFNKRVFAERERATQKNITAQHDRALALLPELLAEVARHYAKKEAA